MNIFKYYWIYFFISLLVFVAGGYAYLQNGLQLSIDFTGGALVEVVFVEAEEQITTEQVSDVLDDEYEISSIQQSGDTAFIIRTTDIDNQEKDQMVETLSGTFGQTIDTRFETVGPTLGRELLIKTVFAISIVAFVITWFIMRQFSELKYGISAVIAMFHDVLILFAMFALFGLWYGVQIDVLFVTAVLTTLSFSVHDTIVVYDRIRELRKKHPKVALKDLVNTATLETLGRSINNSMTIIFMLLALVLLGGETLRWFAVALLVGAITGTYSSPFTAVPLLLLWEDVRGRLKR